MVKLEWHLSACINALIINCDNIHQFECTQTFIIPTRFWMLLFRPQLVQFSPQSKCKCLLLFLIRHNLIWIAWAFTNIIEELDDNSHIAIYSDWYCSNESFAFESMNQWINLILYPLNSNNEQSASSIPMKRVKNQAPEGTIIVSVIWFLQFQLIYLGYRNNQN